jgi:hypothetical protein
MQAFACAWQLEVESTCRTIAWSGNGVVGSERSGFGCIVGQTGMYRPDETIEETNESYTPSDKGRAGQKADAEEK